MAFSAFVQDICTHCDELVHDRQSCPELDHVACESERLNLAASRDNSRSIRVLSLVICCFRSRKVFKTAGRVFWKKTAVVRSLPFRAPGVCFRDGLASQTIRRLQYKVYQGSCLNYLPQQTSTALTRAHAHACQNSLQPQNIYVDSKTSLAAATGRCP